MAILDSGLKTTPTGTQGWNAIATENMELLDSRLKYFSSESVETTDATITTLATIAAELHKSYILELTVQGIKNDSLEFGHYKKLAYFYRDVGGLNQNGSTVTIADVDASEVWGGVTLSISGTDILVQVTGKVGSTIKWCAEIKLTVKEF